MKNKKALLRLMSAFGALVLVVGLAVQLLAPSPASAAQITSRSLTLEDGTTDGGSKPGGTVKHLFNFSLPSTTSLGSIQFLYCTTAADVGAATCVTPTGLSTTGATLTQNTGVATGFTLNTGTPNGSLIISRTAATITAGAETIEFSTVVNPTTPNQTFFVRISTYTSTNATGSVIDSGTVAASTANPVVLNGTMPESLVFCTGDTVSSTSGVPDCTTATNNTVMFNQLFSPTATATATSMMAASTNATSGYAITVGGTTLQSGTNSITAMTTTGPSTFGISQFGMNLVANTTPAVGAAPTPATNGTNYNATPTAATFGTANSFTYNDTALNNIATSNSKASDAQIYTASYIVNVPGSQPAGTYTTTLTFICTPTF